MTDTKTVLSVSYKLCISDDELLFSRISIPLPYVPAWQKLEEFKAEAATVDFSDDDDAEGSWIMVEPMLELFGLPTDFRGEADIAVSLISPNKRELALNVQGTEYPVKEHHAFGACVYFKGEYFPIATLLGIDR